MRRFSRVAVSLLAIVVLTQLAFAAGIEGTWHFVFAGDAADYPYDIVITGDGDDVTGKVGENELKGSFLDGTLLLEGDFYVADAGYSAPLKINGKVDGDKIGGDATWDAYGVSFTATRAE